MESSTGGDAKPPRPRHNSNNNRNKRPNKRVPRGRRIPQAQQLKVTLRKIEDVERYGSVAQVLDMVRTMVAKVNQDNTVANNKTSSFLPIQLDQGSMQRLIQAEALAAKVAAENTQEIMEQDNTTEEPTEEIRKKDSQQDATATPPTDDATRYASDVKGPAADVVQGPCIRARALYVVPPKKSRRRGTKSGCAYFVLSGQTTSEDETAAMTPAEKSRMTAKRRLQLLTAVEALAKHAQDDIKSNNNCYAGCVVQPSVSGKAWKDNHRDNREGTIEMTGDYKQSQMKSKKEAEERLARPRPTPGGALEDLKDENGEQLAAIVLHLRAKRQQEAKRKMATMRKIVPATVKDSKGNKKASSRKDGTSKTNNRGGGAGKKREGKKNRETRGNNAAAAAPVQTPVVLRAGGNGSAGANARG